MKTILVPMDASACAENALLFAILLAQKQPSKLLLLNAFIVPATAGEVPFSIIEEEISRRQNEAEEMLRAQAQKIRQAGGVEFECHALEGPAADVILKVAAARQVDYIVMGSNGEGLASSIFGSTTSHVIEKAGCPVLALPESSNFSKAIKRIIYATDYRSSDLSAIRELCQLAGLWQAQVTILHVDEDHLPADQEIDLMDKFRKKVLREVAYNNLSFQVIHGDDVALRLEEYIEDQNTDLLVTATHRRNLLDRLFNRSNTRQLALDATVPLLAFHYDRAKVFS